ncbi:MAG: ABC transporter permease [Armatimonadota bacterium]|nr:ABC transporter permease [Armatimonadota bacterium]
MGVRAVRVSSERSLQRLWRTFAVAYWLGWQIESNWTDPLLFLIYSVIRPLGGVLILAVMFFVVARGARGPVLGFFVTGTAFWPFVVMAMQGMAMGVLADREHWKTLRYIYSAPISYRAYLVGRSLAQATSALAAMAITLLFGRWVLGIPLYFSTIRPLVLLPAFLLGIAGIVAMGLLITSALTWTSREAWRLPEAVGAALYLLCGVIFPTTVLPRGLQMLSMGIPLTWWLEAMRRGLLGEHALLSFPWASDARVLGTLAMLVAVWIIGAGFAFTCAEFRARALGILDQETGH